MINVKNKVSETAEQTKNAVTETVAKVIHGATAVVHEGNHALSDMARKAVGLAEEVSDEVKEAAHVAAKPESTPAAVGGKSKKAGDKTKAARDKAKKAAN